MLDQAMKESMAGQSTDAETVTKQIDTTGQEEEKKEDEESEEDSDENYDEEGRFIWGKEGEDWEFYYEEDRIAYEKGESTVPETLNPYALPNAREERIVIGATTMVGAGNQLIGASLARDGAIYRTTKKKVKEARKKADEGHAGGDYTKARAEKRTW